MVKLLQKNLGEENQDKMLSKKELLKLHTNQRLLVEELQKRSVDVNILFLEMELLEASYKKHKELILDRDSSINPYAASVICGDKYLAKILMQKNNIQVPIGKQFFSNQINDALIYAQSLGYPIVVKPTFGSHGYDVNMDLENLCDVKDAIGNVVSKIGRNKSFIVEEQFVGEEYRVFVTKKGDYAVLHRDCAHIIGDGKNNIETIANKISYERINTRTNCLCPILIDDVVVKYLARSNKNLKYIPKINEKVYLRHNSNVAMGGICEDYTENVHPSVIDISKKALETFHGLPYAGIDFMSKDITKKQTKNMYRILEVNSVPGVHMHMQPGMGKSINVAKYIVDMMYPETTKR
jgi:cyanophycin synthetase